MTRAITIAYRFTHQYREKIFVIFVAAIIVTALAYVFLLQKAIINVVQRERVAVQTKSAAAEVGELEEQYYSVKNKITIDLAHAKGLKDAKSISYISKKSVTAMVSYNER